MLSPPPHQASFNSSSSNHGKSEGYGGAVEEDNCQQKKSEENEQDRTHIDQDFQCRLHCQTGVQKESLTDSRVIGTFQSTVQSILIVCREAATPEARARMEETAINDLMGRRFEKGQSREYLERELQLAMQAEEAAEREEAEKEAADAGTKQKGKKRQRAEGEELGEPSASKKVSRLTGLP